MKATLTIITLILVSTLGMISRAAEYSVATQDSLQEDYLSKQIYTNINSNPSQHDTLNPLKSVFGINIDDSKTDVPYIYKYARLAEDTTSKQNKIERIWKNNDILYVEVVLAEKDANITIKIYNVLGNEVDLIKNGLQNQNKEVYDHSIATLPNGFYICTISGKNFRDTKKFTVSR